VAIGVGVFAVLAIGGGGYYVMSAKKRAAADSSVSVAATTSGATAATAATPKAAEEIPVSLIEPKSGVTLLIDGVVQPVGKLSVTRPEEGKARKLTARAMGFKDLEIPIDASTKIIEVKLLKDDDAEEDEVEPQDTEKPASASPPSNPVAPAAPGVGKPAPPTFAPKPTPKPVPKPVKPDIPDNPF